MSKILFTDLLKLPKEKYSKLKLIFNSDWDYKPDKIPEEISKKFSSIPKKIELLNLYRSDKIPLLKALTKLHDPSPGSHKRFHKGDYVMCFINYDKKEWLLVNAFKVNSEDGIIIEADEKAMSEVSQFFGRLIVTWEDRKTQNIVMTNKKAIESLIVKTILEESYDKKREKFPGYKNINISWEELKDFIKLKTWKTALQNQKGVYLITDTATNKRYVGSATGEDGILGRWEAYADPNNLHGGNNELKKLVKVEGPKYIKENFRYTILEITDDSDIAKSREGWWKEILLTDVHQYPNFGYNANKEKV